MLSRLFRPRPAKAAGARLYAGVVAQARQPGFYRDMGVPDRIDARFELYTLHVILVTRRLGGQGEKATEASQALFDEYLSALDNTLREIGVGDLSVAKKMRKLAEAAYGRAKAYDAALRPSEDRDGPDREALLGLIGRTVLGDETPESLAVAAPLADYFLKAEAALGAQTIDDILLSGPAWPEAKP